MRSMGGGRRRNERLKRKDGRYGRGESHQERFGCGVVWGTDEIGIRIVAGEDVFGVSKEDGGDGERTLALGKEPLDDSRDIVGWSRGDGPDGE